MGGAVANNSELVVSMDKMNTVKEINLDDRSITAEAGVTTQQIQVAAAENHLFYPVDFASLWFESDRWEHSDQRRWYKCYSVWNDKKLDTWA